MLEIFSSNDISVDKNLKNIPSLPRPCLSIRNRIAALLFVGATSLFSLASGCTADLEADIQYPDGLCPNLKDPNNDGHITREECGNIGLRFCDPDGDMLLNSEELSKDTNPCDKDSDGDLLDDGTEVNFTQTDPNDPDSDRDGVSDCIQEGPDIDHDTVPDCIDPHPRQIDCHLYDLPKGVLSSEMFYDLCPQCTQEGKNQSESCNGQDDNCNGEIDEIPTDVGNNCQVMVGGRVYHGIFICEKAELQCSTEEDFNPKSED